jgi:RNA polymerase sigma-70 factor (sigma-E family)
VPTTNFEPEPGRDDVMTEPGDLADFADFVQRRSGPLLRAAWVLTSGDWALAEDLVQTTLGEVWRRWDRVATMDAPDAYAHKVLVNTSLRWRGRRWAGETAVAELPERVAAGGGLQQVDVRESLRRALGELTAKQRAVIMLRYFEDRSEADTAQIMGCSVGTVKSQAAKAIARLRDVPGLAEVLTGGAAT